MAKVSRESASQGGEYGPVTDRSDEIEGYSVNFTTFHIDMDQSPMLKGLSTTNVSARTGAMSPRAASRSEVATARRSSRPVTRTTSRRGTWGSATSPDRNWFSSALRTSSGRPPR